MTDITPTPKAAPKKQAKTLAGTIARKTGSVIGTFRTSASPKVGTAWNSETPVSPSTLPKTIE